MKDYLFAGFIGAGRYPTRGPESANYRNSPGGRRDVLPEKR